MFSKKLLIPLLSLSLLVTPAYSSHAAENAEAAGTSVEGQGMLSLLHLQRVLKASLTVPGQAHLQNLSQMRNWRQF